MSPLNALRVLLDPKSSNRMRCSLFFLAAGAGIGGWAASLPLLTSKLSIDKGELGLILLCFAAGAIVLMVLAGRFIDRIGSDRLSLVGCICFGTFLTMIPFAGSPVMVALLVMATGAGFGVLDVSMNTTASHLERATDRHLMSSFHALFSVGNLVGAFLVGKIIASNASLAHCLGAAGLFVVATALISRLLAPGLVLGSRERAQAGARLSGPQATLVAMFGVIGFLAMIAEGGMMDWTAVYLVDNMAASESVGAYAFGVFAGTMAIGRFVGDRITARIGHLNLMRIGALVGAVAILAILATDSISVTFIALGLCGLGAANLVPAVFACAGHAGGAAAGRALSMVSTIGYSGLLLGPAFLGVVAQHAGLSFSFVFIGLALLMVLVATIYLQKRVKQEDLGRAQRS